MKSFSDRVSVVDDLSFSEPGRAKRTHCLYDEPDATVPVTGYVSIRTFDSNGRTIQKVEGSNIWTITGREYLAQLMSYENPGVPYRQDRIGYIGLGSGGYVETVNVLRLEEPVQYATSQFLAQLSVPPEFPLYPKRTAVRYSRVYDKTDLTFGATSEVMITEAGLFADGDPNATPAWDPGSRETNMSVATEQAPMAYKSFEPVIKRNTFFLEIQWEIRF